MVFFGGAPFEVCCSCFLKWEIGGVEEGETHEVCFGGDTDVVVGLCGTGKTWEGDYFLGNVD